MAQEECFQKGKLRDWCELGITSKLWKESREAAPGWKGYGKGGRGPVVVMMGIEKDLSACWAVKRVGLACLEG